MTSMEYSYQPEQANWLTKFLWHSAGADSQLLGRCPKSDQVKYECLGGLVLSTSVLAFMSGSYAIYVAFSRKDGYWATHTDSKSVVAAIAVGLFWSIVIYNLERFIVSSMGKVDDSGSITLSKFARALPRIVLSIIVGVVLATPLEVRVLTKEVTQKLNLLQASQRRAYELEYKEASSDENRNANLRKRLRNNLYAQSILRVFDLQQQINRKKANLSIQSEEQLNGPTLNMSTAQREELRAIVKDPAKLRMMRISSNKDLGSEKQGTGLLGQLQIAKIRRDKLKNNFDEVRQVELTDAKFMTECLAQRNENLSKLINEGGLFKQVEIINSDPKLHQISIFLKLLLIIIETSPIFFKMMVSRSTYEVLLDSQQRISSAQQGVLRGGLVTLDGRLVPTSEMSIAAAAYEAELRRRSETEARLADEVHRVVRERTAEEIREHPEDYYSRHGTSTSGTRHTLGTGTPPRYTAHTSGPDPSDPYGRRYVVDPSGTGPTDGPSGADPGMGLVGTGGVETGTSTGSYHVRSREDYERFISTARTVDTVVIPTDTSSESTEHHSGESSHIVGTADSSSSVALSTEHDASTFVADETIATVSVTLAHVHTESSVADSTFDSSSSSVVDEVMVPSSIADDVAEESLAHADVVSPPAVSLEDSEGESTVSDFVSTDADVSGSVDISTGVGGVSVSSGSLDDSMLVAREVAITESPESTGSESHSEESVGQVDSEVSDSGLSRILLPTAALESDTESVSTAHLAEGLLSDDSSSDDIGDVSDHGHPVPSDSIEPVS